MHRVCGIVLLAACASSAVAADAPRVSLELVTQRGLSATAPQEWQRELAELGISGLRIRSATGADEMSIKQLGSADAPSYKVVGILAADGVLYLPGGKFTLHDTGKLRKWLDTLRDDGAEGVTGQRSAFGLTASQLEKVNGDLQTPVRFSTGDMSAQAAVGQIAAGLRIPLSLEAGAARALGGVKLSNELQGLSSGTALAVIVRPGGLVFAPRRERGGQLEYRIGRPQAGRDAWPIGWKPQKRRSQVLPDLFEMLNVEIREISVAQAVAAIQGRLKVPFLYDRNAIALYDADPAAADASVPAKRMSYSLVLRRVLAQSKLKFELRVDEREKPFLWITTVKPAP